MTKTIIYPVGNAPALKTAVRELENRGVTVVQRPAPDVTHLLLPVPSFTENGNVRGGGVLAHILGDLPENMTVIGGNLQNDALRGYVTLDLLQDPLYLAENAAITADCALRIAAGELPAIWKGLPVLVIGWGRIGKCLGKLLKANGALVTVAARKQTDRAMLRALGYDTRDTERLLPDTLPYRVIFNTVPHPVLSAAPAGCIAVDLASKRGISGDGVIWARGLPGRDAPESAGCLMARCILCHLRKEGCV